MSLFLLLDDYLYRQIYSIHYNDVIKELEEKTQEIKSFNNCFCNYKHSYFFVSSREYDEHIKYVFKFYFSVRKEINNFKNISI